ncbi:MAG TPA: DUF4198 domain-containing protein [Anseongella sp.]|nr:DUF4198 domain-containing protein [Anseongella sp.]
MNALRSVLTAFLLVAAGTQVFAHALWIETSAQGKSGKEHALKVFYGEPGAGSPDKIADWWSDVGSFSLWLIKPDGSREQLEVSPEGDHFSAVFTPETEGVYLLSVAHAVKEIADGTQYEFNASARVSVGKAAPGSGNPESANVLDLCYDLAVQPKVNRSVRISGLYQQQPAAEGYITVFSPAGWSKQLKADASGSVTFVPEWPGSYIIETGKGEKVSGQPHENLYRIAAIQFEVAK